MDALDLLGGAATHLFRALLVAAPFLLWRWLIYFFQPTRGGNGGIDATEAAGIMLGLACLPLLIPPMARDWDAIMTPGGVWDLTLAQFLSRALGYVTREMPTLLGALLDDEDRAALWVWSALAFVIVAIRVSVILTQNRGIGSRRFLLAELLVLLGSAHVTVYLAALFLWLVNQLNFWAIPVAIVLIQDYRHNTPPLLPRLVASVTGRHWRPKTTLDVVRAVD
jgi:hypothetical protein